MSSDYIPRRLRKRVAERAGWRCEYCTVPAAFSTQPFEADHVIPRSRGGLTQFNKDSIVIVGKTRTGRATVAALRMNRPELLNLRRVLLLIGEHPP